jgi:hypothetical protein
MVTPTPLPYLVHDAAYRTAFDDAVRRIDAALRAAGHEEGVRLGAIFDIPRTALPAALRPSHEGDLAVRFDVGEGCSGVYVANVPVLWRYSARLTLPVLTWLAGALEAALEAATAPTAPNPGHLW